MFFYFLLYIYYIIFFYKNQYREEIAVRRLIERLNPPSYFQYEGGPYTTLTRRIDWRVILTGLTWISRGANDRRLLGLPELVGVPATAGRI